MKTVALAALCVVLVGVACFFWGRSTVRPELVVERVETVRVQRVVKTQVRTVKKTVTVQPDGTRTEVTESNVRSVGKSQEVPTFRTDTPLAPKPTWKVGALGGIDLRTRKLVGGGLIERNIGGPWSAGVFGLSNGSVGMSLSVTW